MCDQHEQHWLIRVYMEPDEAGLCEVIDSPPFTCKAILLANLDGMVIGDYVHAVQVWESTLTDQAWHAWTEMPIHLHEVREKVLARTHDWIDRLSKVSDEEVALVLSETYGTSLVGIDG